MTSLIKPATLTTAQLISSTAPETDYPAWSAATTYALGDRVIRTTTHRIYEALIAGVDAGLPEDTPLRWADIGPTNRWAMFDQKVGTKTVLPSPLTVVMKPGTVGALVLLDVVATSAHLVVKSGTGGVVLYDQTKAIDGTVVNSFYDYFFAEYEQQEEAVFTGLPTQYANPEVTLTLVGVVDVSCGVCAIGPQYVLGDSQYGASVGILDYSKKTKDEWGNYTIDVREFSKTNSLSILLERGSFSKVFKRLASVRSTPCVYIGVDDAEGFEPMLTYGFFVNFRIVVEYYSHYLCTLEIEGLI